MSSSVLLAAASAASTAPPRPKVGVGVFVRSAAHPGCVLLGQRLSKTSAGAGTFALPGGHLEFGETWDACATREVLEETGLELHRVRTGTVINCVDAATQYHYVVIFMVADVAPSSPPEPRNMEPDKCAGWAWHPWADELPTPVFRTLSDVRALGFDPIVAEAPPTASQWLPDGERPTANGVAPAPASASQSPRSSRQKRQAADDSDGLGRPPYCCAILHERATGALLLEQRAPTARVAAGQLTCFGGKREAAEDELACIERELHEELGLPLDAVVRGLRRAVDLYVDGELIAWFYDAPAPPRTARFAFEAERSGVWLQPTDEQAAARLSPWHAAVLDAWRRGESRADFITQMLE